jgi:hypothetical protein
MGDYARWMSMPVSGDMDCVDVHKGDLVVWFVFGINLLRLICCKWKFAVTPW